MNFETLDRIADAYVPLLAAVFLGGLAFRAARRPGERRRLARVFLFFAGMLAVSYGILLFDRVAKVWASVGLDYSAHAAVALTFVMSLWALERRYGMAAAASFVLYALLMRYQEYHSFADVASTIVPILVVALLLARLLFFSRSARQRA